MLPPSPPWAVLVVDDDKDYRAALRAALVGKGYVVHESEDAAEATTVLQCKAIDVVLLDLLLGDGSGMEFLAAHRDRLTELPVILLTAYASGQTAMEAMKLGAYDYLTKCGTCDELFHRIGRAIRQREQVLPGGGWPARPPGVTDDSAGGAPVGTSTAILDVGRAVGRLARCDATVLITGERSTGQDAIAQALHANSQRSGHRLFTLDCAAVPEPRIDAELFGYESGHPGDGPKPGLIELANGGTMFINEVGVMPLTTQARLLRVIETGRYPRPGGTTDAVADVRFIAAMTGDLESAVRAGRFREDLYCRLRVVEIKLPALRDRREDIPTLAQQVLTDFARRNRRQEITLSPEALEDLRQRPWPGNLGELRTTLERAAALSWGSTLLLDQLRQAESELPPPVPSPPDVGPVQSDRGVPPAGGRRARKRDDELDLLVKKFLDENPGACIRDVAAAVQVSTGKVTELPAWRREMARRRAEQPPAKVAARPLTKKMLECVGREEDPADRIDAMEAVWRLLLERADGPGERAKLHALSAEDRRKLIEVTADQLHETVADSAPCP